MGHRGEAEGVLSGLERRRSAGYLPATHLAAVELALCDRARALQWLDTAFIDRNLWLTEAAVEPRWDVLRSHPRFRELIRRIGLPDAAGRDGHAGEGDGPDPRRAS